MACGNALPLAAPGNRMAFRSEPHRNVAIMQGKVVREFYAGGVASPRPLLLFLDLF